MTPETPEEALQRLLVAKEALLRRIRIAALAAGKNIDENEELRDLERQLGLRNDEAQDGEEPDAPVPAPVLPRMPVLAGGNARRLEEAVEESEGKK
jgi:hypothetical protein